MLDTRIDPGPARHAVHDPDLVAFSPASGSGRKRPPYTTLVSPDANRRLAVAEFVRRLRRDLPGNIVDVRLFGSEARRDAAPDSDIDVLVVVQPDDERIALETRVVDIAFDVNLAFNVFVSPTVLTPAILRHPVWRETPFIERALREGIPL